MLEILGGRHSLSCLPIDRNDAHPISRMIMSDIQINVICPDTTGYTIRYASPLTFERQRCSDLYNTHVGCSQGILMQLK